MHDTVYIHTYTHTHTHRPRNSPSPSSRAGRSFGELGDGTNTNRGAPVQVRLQGNKVVAIAAGRFHAIALVESGEVWGWGCNAGHQLGNGTRFDRAT